MTAIGLFDVLKREGSGAQEDNASGAQQLARLARELIESSLEDLARVKHYEKQFAGRGLEDWASELDLLRSVWELYRQWAADAEQVLARAKSLRRSGPAVAGVDLLEDAMGRVLARLSITPEQIAAGMEQARMGQVVSAGELRNELHARAY